MRDGCQHAGKAGLESPSHGQVWVASASPLRAREGRATPLRGAVAFGAALPSPVTLPGAPQGSHFHGAPHRRLRAAPWGAKNASQGSFSSARGPSPLWGSCIRRGGSGSSHSAPGRRGREVVSRRHSRRHLLPSLLWPNPPPSVTRCPTITAQGHSTKNCFFACPCHR